MAIRYSQNHINHFLNHYDKLWVRGLSLYTAESQIDFFWYREEDVFISIGMDHSSH